MKIFKFFITAILLILFVFLILYFLKEKPESTQETKIDFETDEVINFTEGIDVSEYQGDIDWSEVKESGVEFAIIRLGYRGYGTEGNFKKDKNFDKNMAGAIEAGVDVGVYLFSQAVTSQEAMEEADYIIENISDYYVEYPLFIDVEYIQGEDARANNLTSEQRTDIVRTFCKRIEQAGFYPGVYSSGEWFTESMDITKLSDYFLWLQDYTGEYSGLIECNMLQYTDSGNVNGIDGNVDLNKFFDN